MENDTWVSDRLRAVEAKIARHVLCRGIKEIKATARFVEDCLRVDVLVVHDLELHSESYMCAETGAAYASEISNAAMLPDYIQVVVKDASSPEWEVGNWPDEEPTSEDEMTCSGRTTAMGPDRKAYLLPPVDKRQALP